MKQKVHSSQAQLLKRLLNCGPKFHNILTQSSDDHEQYLMLITSILTPNKSRTIQNKRISVKRELFYHDQDYSLLSESKLSKNSFIVTFVSELILFHFFCLSMPSESQFQSNIPIYHQIDLMRHKRPYY